ncbi:hypothetical protein J6590_010224 [Homalodisca vitripennis]|nr:hypothetical protein J6590_010224 [Homalodisca vitripennis]
MFAAGHLKNKMRYSLETLAKPITRHEVWQDDDDAHIVSTAIAESERERRIVVIGDDTDLLQGSVLAILHEPRLARVHDRPSNPHESTLYWNWSVNVGGRNILGYIERGVGYLRKKNAGRNSCTYTIAPSQPFIQVERERCTYTVALSQPFIQVERERCTYTVAPSQPFIQVERERCTYTVAPSQPFIQVERERCTYTVALSQPFIQVERERCTYTVAPSQPFIQVERERCTYTVAPSQPFIQVERERCTYTVALSQPFIQVERERCTYTVAPSQPFIQVERERCTYTVAPSQPFIQVESQRCTHTVAPSQPFIQVKRELNPSSKWSVNVAHTLLLQVNPSSKWSAKVGGVNILGYTECHPLLRGTNAFPNKTVNRQQPIPRILAQSVSFRNSSSILTASLKCRCFNPVADPDMQIAAVCAVSHAPPHAVYRRCSLVNQPQARLPRVVKIFRTTSLLSAVMAGGEHGSYDIHVGRRQLVNEQTRPNVDFFAIGITEQLSSHLLMTSFSVKRPKPRGLVTLWRDVFLLPGPLWLDHFLYERFLSEPESESGALSLNRLSASKYWTLEYNREFNVRYVDVGSSGGGGGRGRSPSPSPPSSLEAAAVGFAQSSCVVHHWCLRVMISCACNSTDLHWISMVIRSPATRLELTATGYQVCSDSGHPRLVPTF